MIYSKYHKHFSPNVAYQNLRIGDIVLRMQPQRTPNDSFPTVLVKNKDISQ